ncbi:hypothetical protein [Kitasatospora sp. NPDC017646]|uniref:hypothetical protein n=1 Tax=Kitasatospora sp. NPDC017646 TaxID=3364024 RepID=UPI0037B0A7BA
MPTTVETTDIAAADALALRGREKKSFLDWTYDLEQRGCGALDYRLTGPAPVDRMCVKHLFGNLRAIVAFDGDGTAWIVMVGPHDEQDPERNVYARLWKLIGLDAPPEGKRTKPRCCSAAGLAPMDEGTVQDLVDRCRDLARRRRR